MQESLDPKIAELLAAKVAGESLEGNEAELEAWLAMPGNKARAEVLERAREFRYTLRTSAQADVFASRIEMVVSKQNSSQSYVGKWFRYGAAAAAACILAIAAPKLMQRFISPRPAEMKVYSTGNGQLARFTLPDNSTIVLAPRSRIRYSSDFGTGTDRTVMLEGEALFTITHASGSPFTVNTNGITTRVLGTSFAVRRYATDSTVKVIVAQGKVSLGTAILGTGDVATTKTGVHVNVSRENVVTSQLAWTEGRLSFSGAPLREVIPELERWYGISITASPELLDRPIYTQLDTESVSTALELIALAASGRSEVLGSRAIIHAR